MAERIEVRPDGTRRVSLVCEDKSLTRQSEKDMADINKIVARFEATGIMPLVRPPGLYLDVSEIGDYREALEQVRGVEEYFRSLPGTVRAEFENDPAAFLDFVVDPANKERAIELGIVKGPEAPSVAPPGAPVPGNSPA